MEWFEEWFDSKYYHLLYQNRSYAEADAFVSVLASFLQIKKSQKVLDLGCGKGRHSFALANFSDKVVGVDLSPNSIKAAKDSSSQNNPQFFVQDMRKLDLSEKFDFILNLFTSFGYFETLSENYTVIKNISNHLNSNGYLVIDYLNSLNVRAQGNQQYVETRGDLSFEIEKVITDSHVLKHIRFEDKNKKYQFTERVQLFSVEDIRSMLKENGMRLENIFGDYQLGEFTLQSPRMILVAKKD